MIQSELEFQSLKKIVASDLVTRNELKQILVDKITKAEATSLIPDMAAFETKVNQYNTEQRSLLEERTQTTFKSLDGRLVQLRKDTDIDNFKTMVGKKADGELVHNEFNA